MVLFVLDNEPQPQEERETEAMELENFMDVSSSFCCKTSLFFFWGGGGWREVQGHSLIRWGRMWGGYNGFGLRPQVVWKIRNKVNVYRKKNI